MAPEIVTEGSGWHEQQADRAELQVSFAGTGRDRSAAVAELGKRVRPRSRCSPCRGVEVRHRRLTVHDEWRGSRVVGCRATEDVALRLDDVGALERVLAPLVAASRRRWTAPTGCSRIPDAARAVPRSARWPTPATAPRATRPRSAARLGALLPAVRGRRAGGAVGVPMAAMARPRPRRRPRAGAGTGARARHRPLHDDLGAADLIGRVRVRTRGGRPRRSRDDLPLDHGALAELTLDDPALDDIGERRRRRPSRVRDPGPSTTSPSTTDRRPGSGPCAAPATRRSASRTIRRRTSDRVGGSSRSSPATSVTRPGTSSSRPPIATSRPSVISTWATRRSRAASAIARTARNPSRRASHSPSTEPASSTTSVYPDPDPRRERDQRDDLDDEVQEHERHAPQRARPLRLCPPSITRSGRVPGR